VAGEDIERRLAAILSADVAGYSRLMGKDEAGTLAALKALRREVFAPQVAAHNGRIVKLMGDGALVEFPSIVHAVDCAVAVQRGLVGRNADPPIMLRIGVNLGDIIIEGSDIYGDGVNVAARIQEVAEPGGIALSGAAFDQVVGKVEVAFEDAGERELKNIDKPVRVYHWTDAAAPAFEVPLPLPDKPSIAVLPFVNMSGDPEQEYFSDGITEDIITELSRFPTLFVIARNSSFHFKGKAVKVSEVGRDLGVQYVVEGSVRKAGNRVRVTAQLVEAASGNHVWAERYDRELEDIFEVQDEVAHTVAATVSGRLDDAGAERARRRPTEDLAAYDLFLRAYQHVHRWTRADLAIAHPLLEKALELDPDIARAHAYLGMIHVADWMWGISDVEALDLALTLAQRAMSLDDDDSWSYVVIGHVYQRTNRLEEALNYMEKAVALNPNDAIATTVLATVVNLLGRPDEAVEWVEKAMRLDPYHPDWFFDILGRALYMSRRYEEACATFMRMKQPPYWVYVELAACYGQLDRHDQARDTVAAFEEAAERERREGNPLASINLAIRGAGIYYKIQENTDHWLEGLRKAGFDV
jgi:TolB-like protein/Tfp pilus assembly protein PilF